MRTGRLLRFASAGLVLAAALSAHEGEPPSPHEIWSAWSFDPGVVISLALTGLLYCRGARKSRGVTPLRAASFWTGWGVLAIALVSPIHEAGESLFSAHMAQHELLILVAAPLFVLSRPLPSFLWALPFEWRRRVGQWSKSAPVQGAWSRLTNPVTAWALHALALWAWHAPALFQSTLRSEWSHAAQHLSFLLTGLLFWWSLLYGQESKGRGAAVLYVFTTALHTSILGALLTFAPVLWYPAYASTAPAWGLSPIEDQQIGGLLMWVPGGVVYLMAGLALFAAWLRESDAMVESRGYGD